LEGSKTEFVLPCRLLWWQAYQDVALERSAPERRIVPTEAPFFQIGFGKHGDSVFRIRQASGALLRFYDAQPHKPARIPLQFHFDTVDPAGRLNIKFIEGSVLGTSLPRMNHGWHLTTELLDWFQNGLASS
jgi:hypothetical protein